MYTIVYVSSAVKLFSDKELEELLAKAREQNRSLGVTGMLLYKDGNFMQLLEGPQEAVLSLAQRIELDPRHHGFISLLQQEKEEREFADWQMGFKKMDRDNTAPDAPGYSSFLSGPFTDEEFQKAPSKARKLLLNFKKVIR